MSDDELDEYLDECREFANILDGVPNGTAAEAAEKIRMLCNELEERM